MAGNSQPLESDVWPRRQDANRQTKVGGAGACIGSCVLGNSECGRQQDRSNGERLIGHGIAYDHLRTRRQGHFPDKNKNNKKQRL
jgi:hypothetical protein